MNYKRLWLLPILLWQLVAAAANSVAPFPAVLSADRGTIAFEFKPAGELTEGPLRIVNFVLDDNLAGRVDLGLTCGNGLSYLRFYLGDTATDKVNIGVYRPAELVPGVWHRIQFAWTPEQIFIALDGRTIGSFAKRFPLRWGESRRLGSPDTLPGEIRHWEYSHDCEVNAVGDFLRIRVDRPEAQYDPGEAMTVGITALRDNRAQDSGTVELCYTLDGATELRREVVDLAQGRNGAPITLDEPGFIRVKARWLENSLEAEAAAAFAPEHLQAGAPEPGEFDAFWRNAIAAGTALTAEPELSPVPEFDTAGLEVFRISFENIDGSRIYGFLGVPKDSGERVPGLVIVPGAGPGVASPVDYFQEGVVNLFLNVHAYECAVDPGERDRQYLAAYGETDYCYIGTDQPEHYFFYRVFAGFNRAIDWLARHPRCDGKHLGITGSSQGGGTSLIMAGLNPHITHVVANVPALADHGAARQGRMPGWPNFSGHFGSDEAHASWSGFFDAVNFARRIQAQSVTVIVGYLDPTCSPGSIYAAYNAIPTRNKRIIPELDMRHEWPASYGRAITRMVQEMRE